MNQMTQQEVFEELNRRGIVRAEVHFSGGGDEGGVDNVYLFTATDDKDIPSVELREDRVPGHWDETENRWVEDRERTPDGKLYLALGVPVYERYGSFAGEFYVSGKIVWLVEKKQLKIGGHQRVESYEEFGDDIDDDDAEF